MVRTDGDMTGRKPSQFRTDKMLSTGRSNEAKDVDMTGTVEDRNHHTMNVKFHIKHDGSFQLDESFESVRSSLCNAIMQRGGVEGIDINGETDGEPEMTTADAKKASARHTVPTKGALRSRRVRKPRALSNAHNHDHDYGDEVGINEADVSSSTRSMTSFCVGDRARADEFLYDHLNQIQQMGVKKLAKAWIKGICPKKQAKFPYSDKKRETTTGDPPLMPGWWPNTEFCEFKEPDHIKKDERNYLIIHLLRLRPSWQDLQAFNHYHCEPNETHISSGWTRFLFELAPPMSLDDANADPAKVDPAKVEKRRALLEEIYEFAEMEHMHAEGGRSADDKFYFKHEMKPPVTKRKARASSVSSTDTIPDSPGVISRSSSVNRARPSKRRRRDSTTNILRQMSDSGLTEVGKIGDVEQPKSNEPVTQVDAKVMVPGDTRATDVATVSNGPSITQPRPRPQRRLGNGVEDRKKRKSASRRQTPARHQNPAGPAHGQSQWQSTIPASTTTSFGSTDGSNSMMSGWEPYKAHTGGQSFYPGDQSYNFSAIPQYSQGPNEQPPIHVYQAMQLPQPMFQSVSSTPLLSPMAMGYHQFPQVCHDLRPPQTTDFSVMNDTSAPEVFQQQPPHFPDAHMLEPAVPSHQDQSYTLPHAPVPQHQQNSCGHGLPSHPWFAPEMQYTGMHPNDYAAYADADYM